MKIKATVILTLLFAAIFAATLTTCSAEPKIIEVTRIVEVTPAPALQSVVKVTRIIEVTPAPETIVEIVTRVVVEEVEVTRVIVEVVEVEVTRVVTEALVAEVAPEEIIEETEETLPLIENEAENKVYYLTAIGELYRMNLDGSGLEFIRNDISLNSEYMTLDPVTNQGYFTQWDQGGLVKRADLEGTGNVTNLYDGDSEGGQGIALDTTTGKIYWGLYYNGVYVGGMDGNGRWTKLVDASELAPGNGQRGQLQIDTINQHIYFKTAHNGPCDDCLGRKIWRVDFDGSNLIWVYQLHDGDALALDPAGNKMYFADGLSDGSQPVKLMRANLDGSNATALLTVPNPYHHCRTIALDVAHGKMYFSVTDLNGNNQAIMRANLDGSNLETLHAWEGYGNVSIALDLVPGQ